MKKYILAPLVLIALIVTVFAACSKSASTSAPATTAAATATVSIQNFAFSPASVTIKPGGTVTWTNVDAAPHTVTDLKGSFDSGNMATNATFKQTFATPGTYTYHCLIHSMMTNATVVVSN